MKLDHVYRPPDPNTRYRWYSISIWLFFPCTLLSFGATEALICYLLFCLPIGPVTIYVSDMCTLQRDYVVALVQLFTF
jgi:hypothetical protein